MSKAPCKRTKHCWPTTPNIDGSCCIRLHEAKSLTRFKLCSTTYNRVCKRTQHVTPNNIGSCWPTMLRSFARNGRKSVPTLLGVVAYVLAGVCKWMQQAQVPNNVKIRANGRNNSNISGTCCVCLYLAKGLTGFKLCATTPNNTQRHATGCANGRNM